MECMQTITTISTLPPIITQYFNRLLLATPCPDFKDSSKDLLRVYEYIVKKLLKRAKNIPQRLALCEKLEKEFLDLYVQIKAKEEELKEKTDHITQEPFYRFRGVSRNSKKIFDRLKFKR